MIASLQLGDGLYTTVYYQFLTVATTINLQLGSEAHNGKWA